jgi:hypothetical protein
MPTYLSILERIAEIKAAYKKTVLAPPIVGRSTEKPVVGKVSYLGIFTARPVVAELAIIKPSLMRTRRTFEPRVADENPSWCMVDIIFLDVPGAG